MGARRFYAGQRESSQAGGGAAHFGGVSDGRGPRPEKRKDCAGEGEGLCVVYSLTARVRDDSVMLSVERRECGKTVRYDMSPDDARKVFPHVELLWQRIKRESEGHT